MPFVGEIRNKSRFVCIAFLLTLMILFEYRYSVFLQYVVFRQPKTTSEPAPFQRLSPSSLLHLNETIKCIAAIEQIYIINLPDREDRRITSIALFQTLHLDAQLVPALDSHSPQVLSRRHLMDTGQITLLELACWASHMQIWMEIASSQANDTWTLIVEDDIDLEMMTVQILESFPRDLWARPDMIYLGHCGNPPGAGLFDGIEGYRVHRAINPSCTHAYAIRSNAASRLVRLLSMPLRAVDDELVRLGDQGALEIFSIHPPLALQQSTISSHPSDVNPPQDTRVYSLRRKINFVVEWWRGVQFVDQLQHSTLAQANLSNADNWRQLHEGSSWRAQNSNVSTAVINRLPFSSDGQAINGIRYH